MSEDIYIVGDETTIHVYEGMRNVGIYDKKSGVPKFVTGFDRLDNQFEIVEGVNDILKEKEIGLDRQLNLKAYDLDEEWAKNRNREIELEIEELRECLSALREEFSSPGLDSLQYDILSSSIEAKEKRVEKLLSERDDITYEYGLAGKEFNRLYEEKKPKRTYGPNYKEAQFRKITNQMLELYLKKNADYGDSFSDSLDEDGLLVSKIKLKDKLKRFSQLIENDALVDDETMEDTLIDLANYTIMTLMWIREQGDE